MAEAYHIDPQELLERYTRAQVDLMLWTNNWRLDTGDEGKAPKAMNSAGDNKGAANALMGLGAL